MTRQYTVRCLTNIHEDTISISPDRANVCFEVHKSSLREMMVCLQSDGIELVCQCGRDDHIGEIATNWRMVHKRVSLPLSTDLFTVIRLDGSDNRKSIIGYVKSRDHFPDYAKNDGWEMAGDISTRPNRFGDFLYLAIIRDLSTATGVPLASESV